MADVTTEQYDSFVKLRNQRAEELGKQTLKDNPNVVYGEVLSPQELRLVSVYTQPDVLNLANSIYSPEQIEEIRNTVNFKERVAPYNRVPIDFDLEERYPAYSDALKKAEIYKQEEASKLEMMSPEERNMYEIAMQGSAPEPIIAAESMKPVGLDKSIRIAARGFDPDNYIPFSEKGSRELAFNPRNMTKEQWKKWGERNNLKGEYRYINPSEPDLGVAFKPEGEDDFKLLNTPKLTAQDIYSVLIQESPSLAADVGLTIFGTKKLEPFYTLLPAGLVKRGAQILGMSSLSAAGAAGGDFLRLAAGNKLGYNDIGLMEALDESAMIGAMALMTTAGVSTAANVIPKAWRLATGKDVPPEFFTKIQDILKIKRASESGEAVADTVIYGTETSLKQISTAIDDLSNKFKVDIGKYNPTLASATGTMDAADLELLFLKYADDPDLKELYNQVLKGNQEVINRFVKALNDKIGPSIATDATGATVAREIDALVRKDIEGFEDEAFSMIDNVINNIKGGDDIADAGLALLRDVPNEKISTPLFERTMKRLTQIKQDFVAPYNKAFTDAIGLERYSNTTGAGFTRGPAAAWANARKGEANKLFKMEQTDEAVRMLFENVNGGATLRRLRGIDPATGKGFVGKDQINFTMEELNDARTALNSFASSSPNPTANKLARNLERGLEKQMFKLLEEGAEVEMKALGLKVTPKTRKQYMADTKYGYEIKDAWSAQKEAIQLADAEAITSILRDKIETPEKVADYILGTSTPGTGVNTRVSNLMEVLNKEGSDEVLGLQKGIAEYIKRNILTAPDKTPFQIAKGYREFMKDHEGTLKTIFGKDGYKQTFNFSPRRFEREVIEEIQKRDDRIATLKARFGDVNDPNFKFSNVIESLLNTGSVSKRSGEVLLDQKYLLNVIKRDPELKKQVTQITKRYIRDEILEPRQGTGSLFELSGSKLDNFLKEGFGPAGDDVVGSPLTFENFIEPLLGKEGKEYVKNLRILNEMVQREVGPASTPGLAQSLLTGEGISSPISGARMLMRLLVAPLTQAGRRLTALGNRVNNNSRKFVGEMLLGKDGKHELFEQTMAMAEGRIKLQNFLRFLTAHNTVASNDLANEIRYYDTEDKVQKTPERRSVLLDAVTSPYAIYDKGKETLQGIIN